MKPARLVAVRGTRSTLLSTLLAPFLSPILAALLLLTAAGNALAQSAAPIKILVGFPAGGASDLVARLLADKLRSHYEGQTFIVENKPGIGGRLAAEALKTNPADGTSYMLAPNATAVFQHLLYPASTLRYDVLTDLTPVATITSFPLTMAVSNKIGVSNAKEFIAWAKANPKEALFGNAGLGGHTHFTGVQLGKAAQVELSVVPYKGNAPLITDLIGGQVPAAITGAGDLLQQHRAGQLKVIGVFGDKRSAIAPDIPTFIEQGLNVDAGDAWYGVWANARAPKADTQRMEAAIKAVLALPEVREQLLNKMSLNPDFRGAAETDRVLRKEIDYWGPVIKATGFTPQQ